MAVSETIRPFLLAQRGQRPGSTYIESQLRKSVGFPEMEEVAEARRTERSGTRRKALIIGAGHGGLLSASKFAQRGIHAVIFHDQEYPGAMGVDAVSPVLHPETVAGELKFAIRTLKHPLIDLVPATPVTDPERLATELGADAIVLADGSPENRKAWQYDGFHVRTAMQTILPFNRSVNRSGGLEHFSVFDDGRPDAIQGGGNVSHDLGVARRLTRLVLRAAKKYGIEPAAIDPRKLYEFGLEDAAKLLGIDLPRTIIYYRKGLEHMSLGKARTPKDTDDTAWATEMRRRAEEISRRDGITIIPHHDLTSAWGHPEGATAFVENGSSSGEQTFSSVHSAIAFESRPLPQFPVPAAVVGIREKGKGDLGATGVSVRTNLTDAFMASVEAGEADADAYDQFKRVVSERQQAAGYDGDPVRLVVERAPELLVDSLAQI